MTSTSYVYDLTGQGSVDTLHFIFIIAFFVRGKTNKKTKHNIFINTPIKYQNYAVLTMKH